ncbi:response regulator [Kitasatospora phosalacinea]|uniref:DNA-binding response regulator n=1 Tax=Kitasatospora phosalacinea TaxID=2065 RepID=A0A9W6PM39_9ACTN|nr:response regulator transcription factor [Kitasatospora phosalacinea]GLW58914.1 DNA-binding response regulator [Kitasatospora phosalacinea]
MSAPAPVRVLIADDDPLLRAGLAVVLETADRIEVVGQAGDGLRAVELARALRPDVVLMDVRMPGCDGVEATRRLAGSPSRVLVLTTFHHDAYVWGALRAGAAGFLLKRASPERLIDAVHAVAAGEAVLDPAVTRDLLGHLLAAPAPGPAPAPGSAPAPGPAAADPGPLAALTVREREVLRLAAEGHPNEEIAALLHLAESTVKTHVKRILGKLGARDRSQAVAAAYRHGLMGPQPGRPFGPGVP